MRDDAEQIEGALVALARLVGAGLAPIGWVARPVGGIGGEAFTLGTRGGVIATAQIDRTSFSSHEEWPVEIGVRLGVGYTPALNLMPLLTLRPQLALVDHPLTERGPGFPISLAGPADVTAASGRIVDFINENALRFADQFGDAESIETTMRVPHPSTPAGEVEDPDDDLPGIDPYTTQRLVLLAAMGYLAQARALLSRCQPDRSDARFVRQLTRWLDAGGPVAAPLEQTLARLPQPPKRQRPSWSAAQTRARARSEARRAVNAQAKGKTRTELEVLIDAEYARRGVAIGPSEIALLAGAALREQQPFGRARNAAKALDILKDLGADLVGLVKGNLPEDPDWLRPPERASYPVEPDQARRVAVQLDPTAVGWLDRIFQEAPRRLGWMAQVDVWVTRAENSENLVAHIGAHRVGTLSSADADALTEALSAAELFDEDPCLEGRLSQSDGPGTALLEVALPATNTHS